jgi:hypothetical protein
LIANIPNKYLFYSLDGVFLKELKNDQYFNSIGYNNGFVLLKDIPQRAKDYRLFIKDDLDSKRSNRYFPLSKDSIITAKFAYPKINLSNHLLFCSSFIDNTLYSISNNKVLPKYKIDFGKMKLPGNYIKYGLNSSDKMRQLQNIGSSGYYFYPSNIRESKNYLIFRFEPGFKCLYDKNTQQIKYSNLFYDSTLSIGFSNYIAHDDPEYKIK